MKIYVPGFSANTRAWLVTLLCCISMQVAAEQGSYPVPDGPLSIELCMTCHGTFGQGSPVVGGPALAGMEAWYLQRQLENFRAGMRGREKDYIPAYEMRETARVLTDEQIGDLVSMITAWPAFKAPVTLSGDLAAGETLYQSCAACHGLKAEGNAALGAPALAGRSDWYLQRQLKLFRSGYRGTHPDDSYGARMRAMVQTLGSETGINDVLAYIMSLN